MNLGSLSGIAGKIAGNADKLGYAYAVLGTDQFGVNRLAVLISSIQQAAAGVIHAPSGHDLQVFMNNEGKDALMAYVGGIILESVNPQWGNALKKGAKAYAIGGGAIRLFYGATHSEIKGVNIMSGDPYGASGNSSAGENPFNRSG